MYRDILTKANRLLVKKRQNGGVIVGPKKVTLAPKGTIKIKFQYIFSYT